MHEFSTLRNYRSMKPRTCDLCGGKINVGERYTRYSGKYDGDFFDHKYHITCNAVIDEYCSRTQECEYDEESISEWLNDEVCCNLCNIDTRDDCFHSAMCCHKVLKYLEIDRRVKYD